MSNNSAQHTFTGARADRFLTTGPDGHTRIDYTGLDNLLAEVVAVELAKRYRQIATACHHAAHDTTSRGPVAKATRVAYRQLGAQAETIAAAEHARATRRRDRAQHRHPPAVPDQPVVSDESVDLLATAAERLRHAGAANHLVPVRLSQAAGWFQIAAEIHAGNEPCEWCAAGRCPAIEAARLLCGEPAAHRTGNHDRDRR